MAGRIILKVPDKALLGAYVAALREGWSPNTVRNVAPEQIEAIETDPDAFLKGLLGRGGRIRLREGLEVHKIPDRVRWIFAADRPGEPFVGIINLRWQEDEHGHPIEALPEHVLGHIGYSILPRYGGNGYATAALAAMLRQAHEVGLERIAITCDAGNIASRRIIEKNGGRLKESFVAPIYGPGERLRFDVDTVP